MDIIKYSDDPAEYIAAALSPADVVSVEPLPDSELPRVVVPDDQLSLAIGKEGQNIPAISSAGGSTLSPPPLPGAHRGRSSRRNWRMTLWWLRSLWRARKSNHINFVMKGVRSVPKKIPMRSVLAAAGR